MNKNNQVPQFMLEPPFDKILELARIDKLTDEQRAEYERSLLRLKEQKIMDEAFEAGMKIGEKEGKIKGRQIEREYTWKKQTATIKNLLLLGISPSNIANSFDIDIYFVREIQKSKGGEEK